GRRSAPAGRNRSRPDHGCRRPRPDRRDTLAGCRMSLDSGEKNRAGWFSRLKAGLARSATSLSDNLAGVFTKKRLDAETLAALEEALIRADVGATLAPRLTAEIAKDRYDK